MDDQIRHGDRHIRKLYRPHTDTCAQPCANNGRAPHVNVSFICLGEGQNPPPKKKTALSKMEKPFVSTLIRKAAAGKRRRPRHCMYGCCGDGCGVAAAEVAAAAAAARLYCSANLQYKRHKTTDRGEMLRSVYTPTLAAPHVGQDRRSQDQNTCMQTAVVWFQCLACT